MQQEGLQICGVLLPRSIAGAAPEETHLWDSPQTHYDLKVNDGHNLNVVLRLGDGAEGKERVRRWGVK